MLLTELANYAERIDDTPAMYGSSPVSWLIEIDLEGRPIGNPFFTPFINTSAKKQKRGRRITVPHIGRTVGIVPKLLADTGEYVLGIPRSTSKPDRVKKCHEAFKQLATICASATQEIAVQAIVKFLDNWNSETQRSSLAPTVALPTDFDPSEVVTFRVHSSEGDPVLPAEDKAKLVTVQQFWARYTAGTGEGDTDDRPRGWCLVTGNYGVIEQRLPFFVKGVPGGQPSGTALVSANSAAFESFGLANSLTSPISREGGERYAKALNHLLADRTAHLRIGQEVVYCWWTREATDFDIFAFLDTPSDEQAQEEIKALMTAALTGKETGAIETDDNERFFAIALTANNARAVVQNWIDTTLPAVKQHLGRWFAGQNIVDPFGEPMAYPFRLRALAESAYREPKELLDRTPTALFLAALTDKTLPQELLARVVRRIRADGGNVTHVRAALIKLSLTLGDQIAVNDMETMTPNPDFADVGDRLAYHCGRLLAQIDQVQRAALGKVNATIVDRYYGTMSTQPMYVLGLLIKRAEANLATIRKNKPGVWVNLQADFEAICSQIRKEDLAQRPKTLSMQQQSIFALGYYHQRAHNSKQARDRQAKTTSN
ncbi:MAG: type I-C CRISPR-associated protein Cas8c/Csd1 [Spirulinaceae cyanobacterium SM2_1_0]|nr:type I-C CRISPR-associated protein Cas8c/Csd1 [Spirulinaceae cyanobacterium SM2_1_0]